MQDTQDKMAAARESFSGKTMTKAQLQKAVALADVIHASIQQNGSFIEPLTDYAHAFARNERFDAARAEKMIRDVYSEVKGQTMNQAREALMAAEERLAPEARTQALASAERIGEMIQEGPTQPFYQAYDRAAVTLSTDLSITQNAAKAMMNEAFEQKHGQSLYEHGKQIEKAYHKPVREAEIAARKAEKLQSRSQTQSYS